MHLKPYQQDVLNDLSRYLTLLGTTGSVKTAYDTYWRNHPTTPLVPGTSDLIKPYKHVLGNVPNICVKVPTAGGKTLIACHALKLLTDAPFLQKNAENTEGVAFVVWLVPSLTILDQTYKALNEGTHGYRKTLNLLFNGRVAVFNKDMILNGTGLHAKALTQQLSVVVMSFDSFRTNNKEGRKLYQPNQNTLSFAKNTTNTLGDTDDSAIINVIRSLNPIVVVDESHNATSKLSTEMLENLNPRFVFDLTATPPKDANLISVVSPTALKKNNMIKLPVMVFNQVEKEDVINRAIHLREQLQSKADAELLATGTYIRPIILFQATPRNAEDTVTFQSLKKKLMEGWQCKEEEIRIKTAEIDELKKEDLLSADCKVKYIITVNALKEGWDCPFAYILASLPNRGSKTEVTQIVGRILRLPYVQEHSDRMLNMSYILTASKVFSQTVQDIVTALNNQGISKDDIKTIDYQAPTPTPPPSQINLLDDLFGTKTELSAPTQAITNTDTISDLVDSMELDTSKSTIHQPDNADIQDFIATVEKQARTESEKYETTTTKNEAVIDTEIASMTNKSTIKAHFKEIAAQIKLPEFHVRMPEPFSGSIIEVRLEAVHLTNGFKLSKCAINIDWSQTQESVMAIDRHAHRD